MRKEDRIIFHRELGKIIEPRLHKVKNGWRRELATRDIYTKRVDHHYRKHGDGMWNFSRDIISRRHHFTWDYDYFSWMDEIAPYTWIYHYRDFIRDQYYQFKISIRERREIHPDDGEPNELYLMFEKNMHNGGNSFVARVVLTRHTPENDKSFKLAYHDTHPGTIFTNKYDDAGLTDHQKARVLVSLADDFLTMLLHRHSDNLPQIWFEIDQILPIYMSFCYRYRHCTFELDDPNYSCDQRPKPAFMEYLRPDEL